jgi:hypothetical protein
MRTLQEIIEDQCIADDDDVKTLRDAQAEIERLRAREATCSAILNAPSMKEVIDVYLTRALLAEDEVERLNAVLRVIADAATAHLQRPALGEEALA